jgi:hypothetical protein
MAGSSSIASTRFFFFVVISPEPQSAHPRRSTVAHRHDRRTDAPAPNTAAGTKRIKNYTDSQNRVQISTFVMLEYTG